MLIIEILLKIVWASVASQIHQMSVKLQDFFRGGI